MFKRTALFAFIAGALVVLAAMAACGDDDDVEAGENGTDSENGDVAGSDAFAAALAIEVIDNSGFHDTEEAIADGEIPATARNDALTTEALIRVTPWPESLMDQALELADTLNEAAAAYDEGDAEAALPHAEAVHDAQHDFSAEVYAYLGEEAGVSELAGGHGEEDSEGDESGVEGGQEADEDAEETATGSEGE